MVFLLYATFLSFYVSIVRSLIDVLGFDCAMGFILEGVCLGEAGQGVKLLGIILWGILYTRKASRSRRALGSDVAEFLSCAFRCGQPWCGWRSKFDINPCLNLAGTMA